MDIRVERRDNEACEGQPFLLWDSVWCSEMGGADWALYDGDETRNIGGLRSKAALHTAVILSLFTDRRAQEIDTEVGADPRGWWGDAVDVDAEAFETEMGSHLWTLERAPLTAQTEIIARDMALDALQPLIDQGAFTRFEVEATVLIPQGHLALTVDGYSQDGTAIYQQKFAILWEQTQ